MDGKRAEILSAMQSVAEDIRPASPAGPCTPAGVEVDIGGINLRQIVSSEDGRSLRDKGPAIPPCPTPDQPRRDCQRRTVLRLLGIFLLFAAIVPLYLIQWLPDEIDNIALCIGLVCLVGSLVSFAATTAYENA